MFVIIISVNILRLWHLDSVPPGITLDEATALINAACLAEEGTDWNNNKWPLFPTGTDGVGVNSPTRSYLAAAWAGLFGSSIFLFRLQTALLTLFGIFGLFCIGRLYMDKEGALLVVLAASISPWAWIFSRMATDDSWVMPVLLIWGTYFFLKPAAVNGVIAAVMFALAIITYAPAQAQTPTLVCVLLVFLYFNKKSDFKIKLATTGFLVLLFFLFVRLGPWASNYSARYSAVGILKPEAFRTLEGFFTLVGGFISSLALHLSPQFLFFTGDVNLRHSTQMSGHWSWLDIFALAVGIVYVVKNRNWVLPLKSNSLKWSLLWFALFLTALIAPSLTKESIPHALRSVGGWPFVALFCGTTLWIAVKSLPQLRIAILAVAIGFSTYYLHDYFTDYQVRATTWFEGELIAPFKRAVQNHDLPGLLQLSTIIPEPAFRYFFIEYAGATCRSSEQIWLSYKVSQPK